jgi:putative peptidoglycan binding protein/D-alanyl-D-alanine carboxypeptidase-like protein
MAVALLRPGQTHRDVARMKKALVRELTERGHEELASQIRPELRTYGNATVRAVKRFQREVGLKPDGVVGEDTWKALGIDEPVRDARPVLNGVPWEPGVIAIDGIWVAGPLARAILAQRGRGAWKGTLNSGYRPDWYQTMLFKAAVKKYGSEAAARKWVAPPGRSRHRFKDWRGAADANSGATLDAASPKLVRPMSWEPWHVQLRGPGDAETVVPDEEIFAEEGAEGRDADPPNLEEQAVELADVEAAIEELLALYDEREDAADEDSEEIASSYDPEGDGP